MGNTMQSFPQLYPGSEGQRCPAHGQARKVIIFYHQKTVDTFLKVLKAKVVYFLSQPCRRLYSNCIHVYYMKMSKITFYINNCCDKFEYILKNHKELYKLHPCHSGHRQRLYLINTQKHALQCCPF